MKVQGNHLSILAQLIQSELGAIETYHQVVDSAIGEATSARNEFRHLENEHRYSAEALVRHLGHSELPPISPGQWKRFLVAAHDSFKVVDNPSVILALKEGEMRLATQYEEALKQESLDSALSQLIESTLLPRARAHAQSINRFIAAQTGGNSIEAA